MGQRHARGPAHWHRETRLIWMIVLTFLLFILELVVGHITNCVALPTTEGSRFTYGMARAELVGGLLNMVFLLALMLSITTEAVHRFIEPQLVRRPQLLLSVASFGLAVNLCGLLIFKEHGHAGGACHGHSHGGDHAHGHAHSHGGGGCSHDHSHGRHLAGAAAAAGRRTPGAGYAPLVGARDEGSPV
eukprot:gene25555-32408_t